MKDLKWIDFVLVAERRLLMVFFNKIALAPEREGVEELCSLLLLEKNGCS